MSPKTLLTLPPGIIPQLTSDKPKVAFSAVITMSQAAREDERTAVTVAVHHGDTRFARPGKQLRCPATVRRGRPKARPRIVIRLAKILLEIHPSAPAIAGAGQYDDFGCLIGLESVEDLLHLDVKRRVHGIALLRSIESNPRDSFIVGFDQDAGVFFLFSHRILLQN